MPNPPAAPNFAQAAQQQGAANLTAAQQQARLNNPNFQGIGGSQTVTFNADGTPNKFKKALKDYARSGPIGLQGLHGKAQAPVWYRNLKIKALE